MNSSSQAFPSSDEQVLYEQFRYFFNLYFLLVALSQFIPALQV